MPGAGGIIGANALRRAAPDGYTLGILANQHVINVHMYSKMPYDPVRDFTAITALSGGPSALVVPASSPYRSAGELVAAMKKSPGKFNYGSGGKGSIAHLAVESLLHQTGCEAVHVPYKRAGNHHRHADGPDPVRHAGARHRRPIRAQWPDSCAGGDRRVALARFPGRATLAQALPPGFVIDNWSGLFAPAGFPPALTQKLHAAVSALQNAGVFDVQLKANAGELRHSASPAQFGDMVASDNARYGELMKAIGMAGDMG